MSNIYFTPIKILFCYKCFKQVNDKLLYYTFLQLLHHIQFLIKALGETYDRKSSGPANDVT